VCGRSRTWKVRLVGGARKVPLRAAPYRQTRALDAPGDSAARHVGGGDAVAHAEHAQAGQQQRALQQLQRQLVEDGQARQVQLAQRVARAAAVEQRLEDGVGWPVEAVKVLQVQHRQATLGDKLGRK